MGRRAIRNVHAPTATGQEGATAVIVAMAMLLLFGAGAIAIDLGSAWETKRNMIADTDAAALAAAPLVLGTCNAAALAAATAIAEDFLDANMGTAHDPSRLDVDLDCNTGALTVQYVDDADTTLAPAIGVDTLPVLSSSTAAANFLGGGLRPFSVCMSDTAVQSWLSGDGDQDGDTSERNILRLDHTKSWMADDSANPSPCGGASGNWGFVCYDEEYGKDGTSSVTVDNPCGNDSLQHMIREGYQGSVDLGDGTTPPDCTPDTATADDCDTATGSLGGSIADDLLAIQCPTLTDGPDCPVQFTILGTSAYTPPVGPAGGSNATLHPTHFLGVVLREFVTNPTRLAYIEFELVAIFDGGTNAMATGTLPAQPPVLCGVDHSASRC